MFIRIEWNVLQINLERDTINLLHLWMSNAHNMSSDEQRDLQYLSCQYFCILINLD